MKILYGVAGVGYGHATRAKAIADYLQKKGHEVIIASYGQAYETLKNDFQVLQINGMHLIFNKDRLKKTKTVAYNFRNFPKNLRDIKKIRNFMREFNPQLCITDMEPLVTIISKIYSLPLISIDNEHKITNLKIKVPKDNKKDYLIASNIVRNFALMAKYFIVLNFTKVKPNKRNVFVVPPVIREEVKRLNPFYGEKILVYLSKESEKIIKILKEVPEEFIVYGYDINKIFDNLEFKTKENFLKDLEECKAIIATAGFSLMSEAVLLNKPYFALPLKGQFEQLLNAIFLKDAGFGEYSQNLKKKEISHFLDNLKEYQKRLKEYNPDYNELFRVLNKLLELEKHEMGL
jgi:uncharacterized protein (TIGR00661 family)